MLENYRKFEATDPFGRRWEVEFRWIQNAISIRHSDSIDCKYYISDGEEKRELVVALPHPEILALGQRRNRPVTDAWCMKLASLHAHHAISTWEDMDKTIVVPQARDLEKHNLDLERAAAEAAESAALHR
ncbi:MAG: hypothetical protein IT161_02320 [Bryobacterales bacterium]|nr:hypothetical protein [Bryobacterales bacterium]